MPKGRKKKERGTKVSKPEPKEVSEPTEPDDKAPGMVDITALPVWQIIPFFIRIFDQVAWQKMGLILNPMTQEIEKDLDQARAAIDSYEALLNQLGEHIEPDMRKALESRLSDLKLNFATQA